MAPSARIGDDRGMIIERTESPQWLSNAYLVADRDGGQAVLIDANGVVDPLIAAVERRGLTVAGILLTHHHHDHLAGIEAYRERFGAPVYAHPDAARLVGDAHRIDRTYGEGDVLTFGGLRIEVLDTPGHAAGHVSLLVDGTDVFTGDVLFKGTVGGTFAPGATGFADLRASVLRLVDLPPGTVVHPGHSGPTTAGAEREGNPFVRIWRGLAPEGDELVSVWDREATLVLWAPDYDGTNKAWIRFRDDGSDGIVGGSQVRR
jgi:glyoxylase-like metal-dependent hydrolase (beta-lactamase superfamily II)